MVCVLGIAFVVLSVVVYLHTRYHKTLTSYPTVAVQKLKLLYGDVLIVKLGGDVGDGRPHWLPTDEDLAHVRDDLQSAVPRGVKVWVTHHLVECEVADDVRTVVIAPAEDPEEEKLYGGSD